ncbi:unnamed protein product [Schistocephalus solidus]|uniref:BEN domain-containing protein n=1 Tax=Schistocephalus solidus TaxID=70667 RepID=A0A183T876_SCHSO|nr:unnamed protein product [Schistocephalus solidus]
MFRSPRVHHGGHSWCEDCLSVHARVVICRDFITAVYSWIDDYSAIWLVVTGTVVDPPNFHPARTAVEESAAVELDSANGLSPTSMRPEDADSFKAFLLDPIPLPLTPLCWPTAPPPTPQSSETLPPSRKPDSFLSASTMRLRSAKVVQEEDDDEEEAAGVGEDTVRVKEVVGKPEGQSADAEAEEVNDETLNEVEADITSSTSLRKRRYWQLYLESNGWTRATCALMSCLFSRHQMANSTVFGRQSVCGKMRSRLPAKISRRFGVLPSKVRAKMAQKCKDVRRVTRKSTDETLPQLPPLNSFCLPSTTTST